jgi:hypothetical protein
MPAPQLTAVVQDLEQRRAQLNDGKCLDVVASRMPRPLAMEVRQLAERTGTTVSDWLMQAAIEKIVNDERKVTADALADALKRKPDGISQALWNQIIRDAMAKTGKPKKTLMMFTSERDAVRMLLEEAAKWHADAAGAPEKAPQMLTQYLARYKTDARFRAEIDADARQSLEQAARLKARTLPLGTSEGRH